MPHASSKKKHRQCQSCIGHPFLHKCIHTKAGRKYIENLYFKYQRHGRVIGVLKGNQEYRGHLEAMFFKESNHCMQRCDKMFQLRDWNCNCKGRKIGGGDPLLDYGYGAAFRIVQTNNLMAPILVYRPGQLHNAQCIEICGGESPKYTTLGPVECYYKNSGVKWGSSGYLRMDFNNDYHRLMYIYLVVYLGNTGKTGVELYEKEWNCILLKMSMSVIYIIHVHASNLI
ncbi:hypothetical protein BDQ17DRAFT_1331616 [Cyathus striatus]|nr:hypothetical protein BDQ17DRAFT_1331616 [Cyathus striatus]